MKRVHNFIKQARDIRLPDDDRVLMRKKIQEFMVQNPCESTDTAKQVNVPTVGIFYAIQSLFLFGKRFGMPVALGLLIIIFTGVGISSAAEQALPGDLLYPIKVRVNEELRAKFASSRERRAQWEAERLSRRLVEVNVLATKNKLTKDTRIELEGAIYSQSLKVREIAKDFALEGNAHSAAEVSSQAELPLRVHATRLFELSRSSKSPKREYLEGLKEFITLESEQTAKIRVDAEDQEKEAFKKQGHMKKAAEGKFIANTNVISSVETFLEKKKGEIAPELAAQAATQLEISKQLQREGEVKLKEGSDAEAFSDFQEALRSAQEAKAVLRAEKDIKAHFSEPTKVETREKADTIDGAVKSTTENNHTQERGEKKSENANQEILKTEITQDDEEMKEEEKEEKKELSKEIKDFEKNENVLKVKFEKNKK